MWLKRPGPLFVQVKKNNKLTYPFLCCPPKDWIHCFKNNNFILSVILVIIKLFVAILKCNFNNLWHSFYNLRAGFKDTCTENLSNLTPHPPFF